jgi:hypothetical protein
MNTCLAAVSCDSQAASKNYYEGGSAHTAFRHDEDKRKAANGKCEIDKSNRWNVQFRTDKNMAIRQIIRRLYSFDRRSMRFSDVTQRIAGFDDIN